MSSPAALTESTRATTSLAASEKFKAFAVAFAVGGTLTYLMCLHFNWPLFTYHPAVNRVEWFWGPAKSGEGPAMYWYGWTATTIVAAAILGFFATLVPAHVNKKIHMMLVWLLPILSVPYLIWDLRQWWFHP
ncbi:MAG: hypothetical protein IT537_10195 [Hyphomicrobiales bacterium]|nr:hypothetical protein [Hyphomicrobiales bacterium]